jgi:hypothetical protein
MTRSLAVVAIIGSLLAGGPSIASVSSTKSKAKAPITAQIALCANAVSGHQRVTTSQIRDCSNLPHVHQNCPTGPGITVIQSKSSNVALRPGSKPVRFGTTYTSTQLTHLCGMARTKRRE